MSQRKFGAASTAGADNMVVQLHRRQQAAAAAAETAANLAKQETTEAMFLSSVSEDVLLSAVDKRAVQDLRAQAAAIALQWAADESSELSDLDALLYGAVMDDPEEEIDELTDEQLDQFDVLSEQVSDFLVTGIGIDEKLVQNAFEESDEKAALDVAEKVRASVTENGADELIADYAVREDLLMSAVVKVVRAGKVTLKRKRMRKVILNAAQRQSLRKARLKAHTASAKASRRKSNRIRKNAGL